MTDEQPPAQPGPGAVDDEPPARRLRLDVSPLRESRDFRMLFLSGLVSYLGSMFTFVSVPLQAQQLTGSFIVVGTIGLVEVVPLVVFGLWGGALADRLDRRRLILGAEAGAMACATLLLVNALLPAPHVWVLYVAGALFAVCDSIQRPALEALVPQTVEHRHLPAAAALMSLRFSVGFIVGTSAAGIVASYLGVDVAYGVDVASYGVSLLLLLRLTGRGRVTADEGLPGFSEVGEALRYAWSRKDLLGTYAIDTLAMVFAFPMAVFPFVAASFDAPWALGLLYASEAVGSTIASVTSGWTSRVHRHGRAIVLAATAYGLAIAAFGAAPTLWAAFLLLALAGAADMVSGLFRMVVWNQSIPDELRGRMAGVELLSYAIGPQLGNARVSLMAQARGLRTSIVSGGIACAAGVVVLATALPSLWRYDDRTSPHVALVRRQREEEARRSTS